MSNLMNALRDRVLLLDGGMGTQIFLRQPTVEDYGGAVLEGCVDLLTERRPEWIRDIHAAYFEAGADAVETNTFGANPLVLAEFGIPEKAEALNLQAARLAKEVARSYDTPRFVIGSVGPGTKLVTLGHVDVRTLFESYLVQMRGLLKGGADAILIETCQDLLQMKVAVRAAKAAMAELQVQVPIWAQATVETTGTLLVGSDIQSVLVTLEMMGVDVLGMNCATGPDEMGRHLQVLAEQSPFPISCLPNAGLPVNDGGKLVYPLAPEGFAEKVVGIANGYGLAVVGGCCGTTPDHIRALAKRRGELQVPRRAPKLERSAASLYQAVPLQQEPRPLIIGERTNANGSKKFRDLLAAEDWDGLVAIGREQQREGAHLLDVCVAYVGRDEVRDMEQFLTRLVTQIQMPLMVDSTEVPAIEKALEVAPGKAVVNSINFEDGEAKARQILDLCKRHGASVVALTIDEQGMAKTLERKLEVTERIVRLVVDEYGFHPSDLIIDPLTFTLGSGDEEFRKSAVATLESLKAIKARWPQVLTSLGVSNVSFGLSPAARHLLNALMLYHGVQYGLDMAIFNASKVIPVAKVDAEERKLFEDLIFDRRSGDYDPLKEVVTRYAGKKVALAANRREGLDVEARLKLDVIDGEKVQVVPDIDEALAGGADPLHLINHVLLDGMKVVGERFGAGEMQLPFVLESAEAMKAAIARLEPHMPKNAATKKGRLILATVKGDVHDIGKNLVDIILSNNGFEVENLGIKQPIEDILKALEARPANAIGLSGLLVKSTVIMKDNLAHLRERGYTIPVILGGAALTRDYVEVDCRREYAGGTVLYAEDAFEGLRHMEALVTGQVPVVANVAAEPSGIQVVRRGESKVELTSEGQSAWVERHHASPEPPFWGVKELAPSLDDVMAFLDEFVVVRNRWSFTQGTLTDAQFQAVLEAKAEPLLAAWKQRVKEHALLEPRVRYGYFPVQSEGNRLHVHAPDRSRRLATLTFPRQSGGRRLAVSDFFASVGSSRFDVLGLQLVSLGSRVAEHTAQLYAANAYSDYFYLHGLATEVTEAAAEWCHARMRAELGIDGKDAREKRALFSQGYQGSRYSFGYPACPDLEGNGTLLDLLEGSVMGVTLTESHQMDPEFTTSALVAWHPQARYFSV